MNEFTFQATSEEDTCRLAAALADAIPAGTTVALNGTLGAGKTRFVQGFAAQLGVSKADVVSPTFVLVQQYDGRKAIYHIDAYRIADEDEFLSLGVEEYFESDGIVLIEWAERVAGCLPANYLEIQIIVDGETAREFTVTARGEKHTALVDKLVRMTQS